MHSSKVQWVRRGIPNNEEMKQLAGRRLINKKKRIKRATSLTDEPSGGVDGADIEFSNIQDFKISGLKEKEEQGVDEILIHMHSTMHFSGARIMNHSVSRIITLTLTLTLTLIGGSWITPYRGFGQGRR